MLVATLVGCAQNGNENTTSNSNGNEVSVPTTPKEKVLSCFKEILENEGGFTGTYSIELSTPVDDNIARDAEISGEYDFDVYDPALLENNVFITREKNATVDNRVPLDVSYKEGKATVIAHGKEFYDPIYSPTQAFQVMGLIFCDPQIIDRFMEDVTETSANSYELAPVDETYADFTMDSISNATGIMGDGARFSSDKWTVQVDVAEDGTATMTIKIHGKSNYKDSEYDAVLKYSMKAK